MTLRSRFPIPSITIASGRNKGPASWTASCTSRRRRRNCRCKGESLLRLVLPYSSIFLLFANHRGDRLQLITFAKVNQLHALRIAPCFADVLGEDAHHLATGRDQHRSEE